MSRPGQTGLLQALGIEPAAELAEIAEEIGVCTERTRQVERDALQRVRLLLIERLGDDAARALAHDEVRPPPITNRSG